MKNFAVRIAFAAALIVSATPTLHAQAADVTGGSIQLTLEPSFTTLLSGQGVTPSVYAQASSSSLKYPFLLASSGTFDLASALGVVTGGGQIVFQTSAGSLKIKGIQFENFGTLPVLTGSYYLNGTYVGHNTVLNINSATPIKTPIQGMTLMASGIPTTVSPFLSTMLASAFNVTVPPATAAGTMTLNVGLTTIY